MNKFYFIALVTALTFGTISPGNFTGFSRVRSDNSLLALSNQSKNVPCPITPRGMAASVAAHTSKSVVRVKTQPIKGQEFKRNEFAGTAFFFSKNLLITNYHVVKDTARLSIVLEDGREFEGILQGYDVDSDLAVIRVEGNDLPPGLVIANTVVLGEPVVGIGYPLGLQQSITQGIVSGVNIESSFILEDRSVRLIQIDASINPGNSGGPLFNCFGEVIGVNMAFHPSGQGVAWSISAEEIRNIIPSIARGQKIARGYLDVSLSMIPSSQRKALSKLDLNLPQNVGVYVFGVNSQRQPAPQGLKTGDIILSMAGTNITSTRQLLRLLARRKPGDTVTLSILREATIIDIDIILEQQP